MIGEVLLEISVKGPVEPGDESRYPSRPTYANLNVPVSESAAWQIYQRAVSASVESDPSHVVSPAWVRELRAPDREPTAAANFFRPSRAERIEKCDAGTVDLIGPRHVREGVDTIDVEIPLGTAGLRGLVATAIEQAHTTKGADQWSQQLELALTKLEEAALMLLADEMNDVQAWPGGLTDALQGI